MRKKNPRQAGAFLALGRGGEGFLAGEEAEGAGLGEGVVVAGGGDEVRVSRQGIPEKADAQGGKDGLCAGQGRLYAPRAAGGQDTTPSAFRGGALRRARSR